MERADLAVIGGGIVGLATALRLTERFPGRRVVVLEKETEVGRHQTGNNSGVIHSGLYYKPGSLKARNCVEGRRALLAFCDEHGLRYEICGKIVVAVSEDELPRLQTLYERGVANGLQGLAWLTSEQIREVEPSIRGVRGLRVPETGIVDYPAVTRKYAELIRARGGEVRTGCALRGVRASAGSLQLETSTGDIEALFAVNCGGLHSDRVARLFGVTPAARIVPFRGEYYEFRKEFVSRVRHLVYPVPDPAFPFLGVHFTRMIGGGVECGPNAVLALRREGYTRSSFSLGDAAEMFSYPGLWRVMARHWRTGFGELHRSWSKAAFVRALQRLMPDLSADQIVAAGAGVRAQAVRPDGALVDDFVIERSPRAVHVLNAPSPGATASLAIGAQVAAMVELG